MLAILCWTLQLILHLGCSPSWDIRRAALMAMKRIIDATPELAEELLTLFLNMLSGFAERSMFLKRRFDHFVK